jgi:serine/threonine protein kinase
MSLKSYQRVKKAYKKSNRSRLRKSKARSARKLSRSKHKLKPISTFYKSNVKIKNNKLFEMISLSLPENYEIYDYINEGANGAVYLICNKKNNGDCKALKIAILENKEKIDDFLAEVKYNQIFAQYNLGPKIYSHKIFPFKQDTYGLIVMEKIDGTLEDLLKTRKSKEVLDTIMNWIEYSIKMMCKYNLTHGDLHWGNIGYKIDS